MLFRQTDEIVHDMYHLFRARLLILIKTNSLYALGRLWLRGIQRSSCYLSRFEY